MNDRSGAQNCQPVNPHTTYCQQKYIYAPGMHSLLVTIIFSLFNVSLSLR